MTEARRDFTREEILATAQRLFTERGVRATSIGQVAAAAGMTRANLYYYFSSKDELLRETLSATLRRYRQNWSTVPDGATLSELAEHMVSLRYQEVARSGPMDLRFFYLLLTDQAGEREAEMVRAEIEMVADTIRRFLRQGQRRGEVRPDLEVERIAHWLIMQLMGLDMLWLVNPQAVDLQQMAAEISAEFLDRTALPPPATRT
ncbi:TetR/AcrR family transcriptional regulator [Mycobacterium kiyosense]|uniref:TetR/AcrR family transcriptional regulator n=2 Tax=Mycobacteriaceae TaxID=1762 RepID=UPI001F28BA1E|nr:TetR/AcrR family transcriptional regulator [Mycobacterium kiyosense]